MKNKKYVTYARDIFVRMKLMKKNLNIIIKSEIVVTTQENLEELLIILAILDTKYLKKIPVVFHKCSTYDYHFIIKQLAEDF